jgi:hypothetical protein
LLLYNWLRPSLLIGAGFFIALQLVSVVLLGLLSTSWQSGNLPGDGSAKVHCPVNSS